ncbi:MAG: lytic transglycosylase domain-containing protein [Rhodococcus sp. (in: high G+C Gram-positive bacteria)]|uniref:lytic transglycosylase domain-containing protein n=1 Tax=Rhodococcus sp. TaxID=1831 RepID=UPI002ADCEC39|nr:lytic transglycosylase domain-containing protein [Rhodococcus sp. (in: high G+C Gram-positive bacteria)]
MTMAASAVRVACAVALVLWIDTALAEDLNALMRRCAPEVHPATLSRIVRAESGGRWFALADAGPAHLPWRVRKGMVRSFFPGSKTEAAEIANSLLKAGHLVSIGLTQVNNRNLNRLRLSVFDVLDPCTNLSAGAQILTEFYLAALPRFGGDEQRALVAAVSAYNTGDFSAGITNGYVGLVLGSAVAAARTSVNSPVKAGSLLEARLATLEVGPF